MNAAKNKEKINGILLLNKSQGITSNKALQNVKHLFNAQKAGHTGSLDPLATGMLPICFGEATKISQYLLDADKCYETTGLLGIKTNTADSMGEIIAKVENFSISSEEVTTVLKQYEGNITQTPSMFSALKHNGTPLYRLARKGIEIPRQARDIEIKQLKLNHFDGEQLSLTVSCSKGTYIRNLVEDIGDALKTGAHVIKLHRLYTSGFEQRPMYSLNELQAMSVDERINCLIPMDEAVNYLPKVLLDEVEVISLQQGKIIISAVEVANCVRLYNKQAQFIGLGECLANGTLKAKRLLSF